MAANYFDLKVGFTCNNNCVHCVITDKKGTKDLTTQGIKDIIDGVPKDQMVGFTGGEATIRSDFIELLKYARDTGHETALQTNGTQFADWDFAVDASKFLDDVLIAIHSHIPEVHASIVRSQGMYEKTIEGFKNIIKLKIPCSTQTVISKLNIEDLPETYDFIQSIKPGIKMSLTFPHPNGNALHNADIVVPSFLEIKDTIQKILAKHSENLRTEAIPMCYLYPYQDKVYNFDEHLADDDRQGIDPANVNNEFFDEKGITQSYAASIVSEKRKGPKCIQCVFNDRCFGVWKEYVTLHGKHFDLFPITKVQYSIDQGDAEPQVCEDDTCECEEEIIDYRTLSPQELVDLSPRPAAAPLEACNDEEKCEDEDDESLVGSIPAINQEWGSLILYGRDRCMNRCTFCSGVHGLETPEEKYRLYMKEADHFLKDTTIRKIEISGGDPGEYDRLPQLISYLTSNGVTVVQLSTHGRTLGNEEYTKALKQAGVTGIRIPLYGSIAAVHNKTAQYEQTPGNAFEETVAGIKMAVKYKIPIIGYTLLNQYNKTDINSIIQLYLTLAGDMLRELYIGLTFISNLSYDYTSTWFLPIKDLGPYMKEVYHNHPPLPETLDRFVFLDIPYCVFGEYVDEVENKFEGFPNLGAHKVEESNRSTMSDLIPHYRIKSYFEACENCDLNDCCGAVPLNEIKMFGTYGLTAIKEE